MYILSTRREVDMNFYKLNQVIQESINLMQWQTEERQKLVDKLNENADKLPGGLEYWKVDEVIEALSVSDETRKELMNKMPHAYDRPAPGEDDGPEPDRDVDKFGIKNIWHELSDEAKHDIISAYRRDYP